MKKMEPLILKDLYRSQTNPLRGLNMSTVVTRLEEGERGRFADLQWLYRFVEKKDATLRACKKHVISSVSELDWSIKVRDEIPVGKQRLASAQEKLLIETYERFNNLQKAIKHLTLSEFRGFSHVQKRWVRDGKRWIIDDLEPVPQWHWTRDGIYGEWKFVEDASSYHKNAVDIFPDNFLIREVDDPINEIALVCFVRKAMSQKDWDGFVEVFGIPFIFLILPELADEKEREKFEDVVGKIIGDARGALPHGTEVKEGGSGSRGVQPFERHLKYQDGQIVLAATGSTLTMLAESGTGTLGGNAHQETFEKIALGLGKDITETFQRCIDHQVLDEAFPGSEHYAYFELEAKQEDDVTEVIDHAVKLKSAGFKVSAAEVSERTGYDLEDMDQSQREENKGKPEPTMVKNRGSAGELSTDQARPRLTPFEKEAREQFGQALASDLGPFRAMLEEFSEGDLSDEELQALETKISEALPALLRDNQTSERLRDIMATAVANGAESARESNLRSESVSGPGALS